MRARSPSRQQVRVDADLREHRPDVGVLALVVAGQLALQVGVRPLQVGGAGAVAVRAARPARPSAGPGRAGRRRGSTGSSSSARSWPADASEPRAPVGRVERGGRRPRGRRRPAAAARRRGPPPGAWLTAPPGASAIARSRTCGQPLGPAEHRDARAGRGRRAGAGAVVGLRQPGQQRRHLGVPAGEVEAGQGAGGVADGEVERARRPRAGCPRPAGRRAGRRPGGTPSTATTSGPSGLGHQRQPVADGGLARLQGQRRPGRARPGSPRTSPGTGSTSRNRRSPRPRSAVSAEPSGTASVGAGQAGDPVARCRRAARRAPRRRSVRPVSQAVAQTANRPAGKSCTRSRLRPAATPVRHVTAE